MRTCHKCRSTIHDDAELCPYCRTDVTKLSTTVGRLLFGIVIIWLIMKCSGAM